MNPGKSVYRGGGGGRPNYGSRGRSPISAGRNAVRRSTVGAQSNDASPAHESGSSNTGRNSEIAVVDGVTKQLDRLSTSEYTYGPDSALHGVGNISQNVGNSKIVQNVTKAEDRSIQSIQSQDSGEQNCVPSNFSSTPRVDVMHKKKEPSQTVGSEFQDGQLPQETQSGNSVAEGTSGDGELENSDFQRKGFSFDICLPRNRNVVKLKSSLLVKNRAKRNETKLRMEGDNLRMLRPGMILLKGYLSLMDQVKLIKSCRDLGQGSGGFYQPGYRDGAKLHLKMMCLGKNWDPETSMYTDERPVDGAKPPPIPDEFQLSVKGAIEKCHDYLDSHPKARNAREMIPPMSPNICIINFYTQTGRLGLHQDKDETQESLRKGIPVVSFSIGDSAEFLYGDQRDIDKAEKVVLESGDVLIFGGKSRHIFHGVTNIFPDTAPKALLEESDLIPGRLNLTFREY